MLLVLDHVSNLGWFPERLPHVRLCHVWATPSHLAASATYVACVTPCLLAFPTPSCVSCRPAVTILQQQLGHLLKPKPISPPTMGLKLRMGLALSGLALSSMFGVNMLSGIKVCQGKFIV